MTLCKLQKILCDKSTLLSLNMLTIIIAHEEWNLTSGVARRQRLGGGKVEGSGNGSPQWECGIQGRSSYRISIQF